MFLGHLCRHLRPIRSLNSKAFLQVVVSSFCHQRPENTRKALCTKQRIKKSIKQNVHRQEKFDNSVPKVRLFIHSKVENQMGNICKRVIPQTEGSKNGPATKQRKTDGDDYTIKIGLGSASPDEHSRSEISECHAGLRNILPAQRTQAKDGGLIVERVCVGHGRKGDGDNRPENDVIVVSDSDSVKLISDQKLGETPTQLPGSNQQTHNNEFLNDSYIESTSEAALQDVNIDMAYGGQQFRSERLRQQQQHYNSLSSSSHHPQQPYTHQKQSRWDQPPVQNTLTFPRQWEDTELGVKYWRNAHRPSGFTFSLMCYNTLAQSLITPNMYLYPHCDKSVLQWQHRKELFQHQFKFYSPDILCLQEIDRDNYHDFYRPFLGSLGYDGLYKKRCGDKKDGCATFYKTSKFSLICWNLVDYFRHDVAVLDKDNVAIICLLKPSSNNTSATHISPICVANTHLLFNPKRGDIKLAQVSMMLAEADKMASSFHHGRTKHCPNIVICGDFNSIPFSPMHHFLLNRELYYPNLYRYEVSGQEGHGPRTPLDTPLWPGKIGVTDQCQMLDTPGFRYDVKQRLQTGDSLHSVLQQYYQQYRPAQRYFRNAPEPSDTLTHPFHLRSVYHHHAGQTTEHDDITSHHRKSCCVLDYMFYSSDSAVKKGSELTRQGLNLLSRVKLLSPRQLEDAGGLPNQRWPSDHLFLMGKFLLLPDQ